MRQRRRLRICWAIVSALILTSTVAGPAHADSTRSEYLDLPPLTATSSQDIPKEYLVYPDGTPLPPGTPTMTNEEMEAFRTTETGPLTKLEISVPQRAGTAAVVGGCGLSVGTMWIRSSSSSEPYGGVGSKPAVTGCWGQVTQTFLQSFVWMNNGWIWFSAAGPFNSYGTWNMVQKSVVYVCKGTGVYPFFVNTFMRISGPQGVYDQIYGSTAEYKFKCG